jgi:hypothetical protein
MRCNKLFHLCFFLSTAFSSPVLYKRDVQDAPELFTKLLETATGFAYAGRGLKQQLSQLADRISEITTGKATPIQTVQEGFLALSAIPTSATVLQRAISIVSAGLVPPNILDILNGIKNNSTNSHSNNNTEPPVNIYPKSPTDAPYDILESDLLSSIFIPQSFTCTKISILLIPGTADPAGSTFYFSYGKLFETNSTSPVWVNIPGNSLSDIQDNAEYVAYAINYISALCSRPIGVLSWSQGSLDVQWALKYWPSTRTSVSDFMAVSPDFHGTLLQTLCMLDEPLCTPSIQQQGYESAFIHALREEDGDSAYVPTTNVYSGVDFVVQPQSGDNASGALKDVRGVGASNTQIQVACAGRPAGGFYSHSAMLVNPLTYALFVDALSYEGPGRMERVTMGVCKDSLAPGLRVSDFLGTEAVADVLGPIDVLLYRGQGGGQEPKLKDYVYKKARK